MHSWPATLPTTSGTPGTGPGSDYTKTFIMGVQLGRRIKILDALRKAAPPPVPPIPSEVHILAEDGTPITDERFGTLISLVNGGSFPVTTIDYKEPYYGSWYVMAQDVPPASQALTVGEYTVADTGTHISFHEAGPNYAIEIWKGSQRIKSVAWNINLSGHLYFFCNINEAVTDDQRYALQIYRQQDEHTLQMPLYFTRDEFEYLFFDAGNSGLSIITE